MYCSTVLCTCFAIFRSPYSMWCCVLPPYPVRSVSEHMGWVRNVVLMSVYLGLGNPRGSGFRVGARWAGEGNTGVSLRATQGRGGRILSQQGGFQVSGKGNKGSKGIIMYITYLSYVYNGMIAAMNDTSCICSRHGFSHQRMNANGSDTKWFIFLEQ